MKIRRRIVNIDNEEDDYIYELTFKNNIYIWDCLYQTPPESENAPPLYLDSKRDISEPPEGKLAHTLKFKEKDLGDYSPT